MIENIKAEVFELLGKDDSGHGMDHINRVLNLSLKFAKKENANEEIVTLIALLHDVDDYKLFGKENSESLTNANKIMNNAKIDEEIKKQVLEAIKCIGYSKRLKGLEPKTIEGKIVSDADMCDGLGVNGILRPYAYHSKKGSPFFDKNIFPIENMTANNYTRKNADSAICHIFEKVLKLKDLMLTDVAKKEAEYRHQIVVEVLYHFFEEEDVPEWTQYLDNYLKTMDV